MALFYILYCILLLLLKMLQMYILLDISIVQVYGCFISETLFLFIVELMLKKRLFCKQVSYTCICDQIYSKGVNIEKCSIIFRK
jgi:hypothetical protein